MALIGKNREESGEATVSTILFIGVNINAAVEAQSLDIAPECAVGTLRIAAGSRCSTRLCWLQPRACAPKLAMDDSWRAVLDGDVQARCQ